MTDKNIRYVGTKDVERAFADKTGIEWAPGAVHPVEVAIASKMLQHPDVFADGDKPDPNPRAVTVTATGTSIDPLALAAFTASGLTIAAWNALDEAGRTAAAGGEPDDGSVIEVDGATVDLDKLDKPELQALAAKLKVTVPAKASGPKLRDAILAAAQG